MQTPLVQEIADKDLRGFLRPFRILADGAIGYVQRSDVPDSIGSCSWDSANRFASCALDSEIV